MVKDETDPPLHPPYRDPCSSSPRVNPPLHQSSKTANRGVGTGRWRTATICGHLRRTQLLARTPPTKLADTLKELAKCKAELDDICKEKLQSRFHRIAAQFWAGLAADVETAAQAQEHRTKFVKGQEVEYFQLVKDFEACVALNPFVSSIPKNEAFISSRRLANLHLQVKTFMREVQQQRKRKDQVERKLFARLWPESLPFESLSPAEKEARAQQLRSDVAEKAILATQEEIEGLVHQISKDKLRIKKETSSSKQRARLRRKKLQHVADLKGAVERYNVIVEFGNTRSGARRREKASMDQLLSGELPPLGL